METKHESFLGRGWAFPPTFNKLNHSVDMVQDEMDISQSLHILFTTQWKERIMFPKYGCDLSPLQFDALSATLITKLKAHIEDAILLFEPRITLLQVDFNNENYLNGVIHIVISYLIKASNTKNNIVFPYYIQDRNGINN